MTFYRQSKKPSLQDSIVFLTNPKIYQNVYEKYEQNFIDFYLIFY